MLIMQKCITFADKLYEEFTQSVNRKTQSSAWKDLAQELNDDGIAVIDVHKLKQNVTNWVRRANVSKKLHLK